MQIWNYGGNVLLSIFKDGDMYVFSIFFVENLLLHSGTRNRYAVEFACEMLLHMAQIANAPKFYFTVIWEMPKHVLFGIIRSSNCYLRLF